MAALTSAEEEFEPESMPEEEEEEKGLVIDIFAFRGGKGN